MAFTERSRPAREAILAAARSEFGALGFDRTTVRAVAAKAGADPAMVIRYYGSKEGLFAAAVDVDLALPPPPEHGRLGTALGERFVQLWEGPAADGALQILLRSAATSPAVAERIRSVFADQVQAWVGLATGPDSDLAHDSDAARDPDAAPGSDAARDVVARRAARVATYVLGTALCRYVLELQPIADLDGPALAQELGQVLQLLLDQG